ncbi:MAG: hypothetical protein II840_01610 [Kiritimatiellae bacterium]|nr:hypothetical protein [Kiritimatiellia bacterium]
MMKSIIAGFALMLVGAAFADDTGLIVSFSSPGPDTYADGNTVVDGECYALVWTGNAANFAIADDGTVTGGKVVATLSVAKGDCCPPVKVRIAADIADEYSDGSWGVYLFDTRGSSDGEKVVSGVKLIANATIEVASERFLKHSTLRSGRFLASAGSVTVSDEEGLRDALASDAAEIVLGGNIVLANELVVSRTVTLDLGAYTITAANGKNAIQVAAGGNLTINAESTGGVSASNALAIYTDYELSPGVKTITINGGVFDGALQFNKYPLHTSAVQSGEAAVPTTVVVGGGTFNGRVSIYHCPFTVNDGTFEQGIDTSDGSVTVYANYKCPVMFNGGSFKVRPTPAGSRVVVNGGVYYENGYFKVGDIADCQATRNGTYYASLAEAFQDIGPGTVITVLGGDASSISVELEPGQSLTVPSTFDGNKITGKGGAELVITYADGTATYMVKAEGAARIGAQYFATLQEAFSEAAAGDTITLVGDDTLALPSLDRAITLDLNGHNVTVTGGAADLSAGALTVVGSGHMTGFVEPSAGKMNLVLKGGTYGFDPSKYAPYVIEALPNEQDPIDWSNDRHYVFKDYALGVYGGFPYWASETGVWTVVPVPKAYVSAYPTKDVGIGDPLDAAYSFGAFNANNGGAGYRSDSEVADTVITGDGTLNLNELTDPEEISRALAVLTEATPFLGWHADFAVSFDKPITARSLTLAGQYNGFSSSWVSYSAPANVGANVVRRLLADEGGARPSDWPYQHICTKVKDFNCGARMDNDSLAGTTMKVQLRLYKPDSDEGTGSPSILICEYKYTFGGKAARIEDTFYDSIDAAIAAVQSNDVVVVLNDYTGAVDLNRCDRPFILNRNGFVLNVTDASNINDDEGSEWHFDRMSNGSWSYYNKPQPKSAEEAVVMVEVVDQDGEAMSISALTPTQEWLDEKTEAGVTTPEQAVTKIEENGLPAWQNYVIGQDPEAAVRVNTEQNDDIKETPVQNTLSEKVNVPADSGFKVTYALDKIEADGTVEEGTPQATAENFTVDLAKATKDEDVAYFKLTAIIEAEDGTGAKTKVTSENTLGVLKVDATTKNTPVAVPWSSLADDKDITVDQLVRTATLTPGDTMTAYNNETGKYNAWVLNSEGNWEAAQTSGGADPQDADAFEVPRGAAVWVTRQDPTQPLYLVGEVAEKAAETQLEPAPSEEKKSWNLVASPSVEPTKVEDILAGNENVDAIMVPTDGAPKVYIYRDGKWGYETTEEVTRGGKVVGVRSVFKTDDTEIPAGTGFWYLNGSTDDNKTVEW